MEQTNATIATPLAERHRQSGARMGTWFGCDLPSDFGDWPSEYRNARRTVALLDTNYHSFFSFTGPDRVRYVNAILTGNIKDLKLNHADLSLLLNPQGRILAEIETLALQDSLLCISFASVRERLAEVLEKFIIMDDVTLTDETPRFGSLMLYGPNSSTVILQMSANFDPGTLDLSGSLEVVLGGLDCRIIQKKMGTLSVFELITAKENLLSLWDILSNAAKANGGGPIGYTAWNSLSLEENIPWFGNDFGEKQIPHEAGLQDSHISYTKGCYTGQEIVERVRSRGQVNRQRVLLRFSGEPLPAAGTPLTVGGKEAGLVTRSAEVPDSSGGIGMGYLRKENNSPASILDYPGGTATVIAPATAAASD